MDRPAPIEIEITAGTSVVLLTIDTLRADHLSRNGHPRATTPFLDRLAAEGVYFSQAYAQASWTLPSMLSLISSLPPPVFGVTEGVKAMGRGHEDRKRDGDDWEVEVETFSEEYLTLPEVLSTAGYATAGFSTNGHLSRRQGFAQGFETFDQSSCMWRRARCVFRAARRWLYNHLEESPERPFFLWIHLFDPHFDRWQSPPIYRPQKGYEELFDPAAATTVAEKTRLDYDRKIRYADDQVAEFVGDLETRGIFDRLLFAVAADHGEEFHEKGRWGHSKSVTNTLVHVPLLLRLPERQGAGTEVGIPVPNLDLAPSLLDLLGFEPPASFEGQSLRPLLEGRDFEPRPIYGETRRFQLDLRFFIDPERNRKLVVDLVRGRRQLYDLTGDPGETDSLARQERRTVQELERELRRAIEEMEARGVRGSESQTLSDEEIERLRSLGYAN